MNKPWDYFASQNKVIIGIIVLGLLAGIGLIVSSSKKSAYPISSTTITPRASESAVPQEQNMIILSSSGFSQQTLTIKAGDKVTWVNKSGADVAINSAPHPTHTDYPPLNLGAFPDGGELSLIFDKAGSYKYHNHLNPSQTGTIIVQ